VKIYDAVLNHSVRAPAEFAAYVRAAVCQPTEPRLRKRRLLAARAHPIGQCKSHRLDDQQQRAEAPVKRSCAYVRAEAGVPSWVSALPELDE
jgi:hypothetical protein